MYIGDWHIGGFIFRLRIVIKFISLLMLSYILINNLLHHVIILEYFINILK